jgi:hypothetical protein
LILKNKKQIPLVGICFIIVFIGMSKINPELKKGDRIILVHMDGESLGAGIKGEVSGISQTPSFGGQSSYQYNVQWFDEEGKQFSQLSLLPDVDAWIMDTEFEQGNIQEINFKNLDDLISKGDFLAVFSKKDLEEVYKFLELERQIGSHNMILEGGKFLMVGPSYIKDFFKLQRYNRDYDEDKEILIEKLISRSQNMRDMFIRNAMKYLENQDKELSINNVQRTMIRLVQTAKEFWMNNADKFLNN